MRTVNNEALTVDIFGSYSNMAAAGMCALWSMSVQTWINNVTWTGGKKFLPDFVRSVMKQCRGEKQHTPSGCTETGDPNASCSTRN